MLAFQKIIEMLSPQETKSGQNMRDFLIDLADWHRVDLEELEVKIRGSGLSGERLAAQSSELRKWRSAWQEEPNVVFEEKPKGVCGVVRFPMSISFPTLKSYADWTGQTREIDRIAERIETLKDLGCSVTDLIPKRNLLMDMACQDFSHLCDIVLWKRESGSKLTFMRNIAVPGMDTKWIESRLGLLSAVFESAGLAHEGDTPLERCGFISDADYKIPVKFAEGDFAVLNFEFEASSFKAWPDSVKRVIVFENKTSFLECDPEPGMAVMLGNGRAVEAHLPRLAAASSLEIVYQGDCDSFGYDILNNLRATLPHVTSRCMHLSDILSSQDYVVIETDGQRISRPMDNLTPEEKEARQWLLERHLRLEQERIKF